jgi:SAM-dependent methyltransferase
LSDQKNPELEGYRSSSLDKLAHYSGDPWGPGNPYYEHAEQYIQQSWEKVIWPFIGDVADFTHSLDLAAGHGRNSEFLLRYAETLVIMDIQPGNIELCRARFADELYVSYHVCNGYDLRPLADESLTFIYCFDAMVHFDSDVVRSYLKDMRRVLRPGARAFLHHSNYTGGHDWRSNPHSRNFMSREMFGHYAVKEGLTVMKQQLLNWGNEAGLDCMSIIEKPLPVDDATSGS